MIAGVYKLLVCPDPECDYWDVGFDHGVCPNYDVHTLGGYPDLVEIEVIPTNGSRALVAGAWRRHRKGQPPMRSGA